MRTATTIAALFVALGCTPRDPRGGMSTIEDSTSAGGDVTRAGFDDLDVDSDERLDSREFFEVAERYYDRWDVDEDGRLTASELTTGIFESWDRDNNGRIDREELETGVRSWVPATLTAEFERWDMNWNDSIDRQELRRGVAELQLFDEYDQDHDGSVTDLEFARSVFLYWDTDRNERVDALEWRLD